MVFQNRDKLHTTYRLYTGTICPSEFSLFSKDMKHISTCVGFLGLLKLGLLLLPRTLLQLSQ